MLKQLLRETHGDLGRDEGRQQEQGDPDKVSESVCTGRRERTEVKS